MKPLLEFSFAYAKNIREQNCLSKTLEGISYYLNHEKNLKVFLEDGEVPLDNNAAESALRTFCVHKQTWRLIDTIDGAKANTIVYSITEMAKVNNLNSFPYLEFLRTELMEHLDNTNQDFVKDRLLWLDRILNSAK